MRLLPAILLAVLAAAPARAQGDGEWQRRKEEASRYFEETLGGGPAAEPTGPAAEDPAARPPAEPPVDPALLRDLIVEAFDAYETEDVGRFLALLAADFVAADRSGKDYRAADMARALGDDFAALDRIRFTVFVGAPAIRKDGRRAQVEVRWSRRAWIEVGGQEWILTDQRSVFEIDVPEGGTPGLSRIFGDAIFGLARPSGRIVLAEGTLDGEPIEEPIEVDRTSGIVQAEEPEPAPAPASTVIKGVTVFHDHEIDFDTQTYTAGSPCATTNPPIDLLFFCFGQLLPDNGAGLQEIAGPLDSVAEAPAGGYSGAGINLNFGGADVGRTFAMRTTDGKFVGFEITAEGPAQFFTVTIVYQPDGSRRFK